MATISLQQVAPEDGWSGLQLVPMQARERSSCLCTLRSDGSFCTHQYHHHSLDQDEYDCSHPPEISKTRVPGVSIILIFSGIPSQSRDRWLSTIANVGPPIPSDDRDSELRVIGAVNMLAISVDFPVPLSPTHMIVSDSPVAVNCVSRCFKRPVRTSKSDFETNIRPVRAVGGS